MSFPGSQEGTVNQFFHSDGPKSSALVQAGVSSLDRMLLNAACGPKSPTTPLLQDHRHQSSTDLQANMNEHMRSPP